MGTNVLTINNLASSNRDVTIGADVYLPSSSIDIGGGTVTANGDFNTTDPIVIVDLFRHGNQEEEPYDPYSPYPNWENIASLGYGGHRSIIKIESEEMLVTRVGDDGHFQRGYNGTTPAAHANGLTIKATRSQGANGILVFFGWDAAQAEPPWIDGIELFATLLTAAINASATEAVTAVKSGAGPWLVTIDYTGPGTIACTENIDGGENGGDPDATSWASPTVEGVASGPPINQGFFALL